MADKALTQPGPEQIGATNGWLELGLSAPLASAVSRAGFRNPTELQKQMIPLALQGRDCLVQAGSGSGKTAAYALPILQRVTPGIAVQALVLAATRELVTQIYSRFRLLAAGQPLRIVMLLGSVDPRPQMEQLRRRPEVVIGLPRAVSDLARRGALKLGGLRMVVLDEVDRMLEMGLRDDLRRILSAIRGAHQTILVSESVNEQVRALVREFARDPVEVRAPGTAGQAGPRRIRQGYITVCDDDKFAALAAFLAHVKPALAVVYVNTKEAVRQLAHRLRQAGTNCREAPGSRHDGRAAPTSRDTRPDATVLVATDPPPAELESARVSHIVNYDLPQEPEVYLRRISRVGRTGISGYAVSFVTPDEGRVLTEIEKAINQELPRIEEPWVPKPLPPPVPPAPEPAPSGLVIPKRYTEALRRDEVLEAHGIKPLPRTLGSRFRPPRRRR